MCGKAFKPTGTPMHELKRITLYLDELEALRLCDYEGMFQEQAGEKMGVSRGTVQRLLTSARKKVAEALTQGNALVMGEHPGPE
jgi:predicted DNA-binding protein (UPF0251 family)